jgi:hypothetical protein
LAAGAPVSPVSTAPANPWRLVLYLQDCQISQGASSSVVVACYNESGESAKVLNTVALETREGRAAEASATSRPVEQRRGGQDRLLPKGLRITLFIESPNGDVIGTPKEFGVRSFVYQAVTVDANQRLLLVGDIPATALHSGICKVWAVIGDEGHVLGRSDVREVHVDPASSGDK